MTDQPQHPFAVAVDPYAPVGAGEPVYAPPPPPTVDPSRPCGQTAGDLFMSLNGFDEIAVTTRFGAPIAELRSDAITLGRALAFVHMRRSVQGQPNADETAYQGAMALTIQQVSHEYFQPDPKKPAAEPSGEPTGVA